MFLLSSNPYALNRKLGFHKYVVFCKNKVSGEKSKNSLETATNQSGILNSRFKSWSQAFFADFFVLAFFGVYSRRKSGTGFVCCVLFLPWLFILYMWDWYTTIISQEDHALQLTNHYRHRKTLRMVPMWMHQSRACDDVLFRDADNATT